LVRLPRMLGGNPAEGERLLREVVQRDDSAVTSRIALAKTCEARGDRAEAVGFASRALEVAKEQGRADKVAEAQATLDELSAKRSRPAGAMAALPSAARATALAALPTADLDLLVVGGGITGAGIARDAALRSLSVALLEAVDFAAGTSSRSSKLVHGGVRYLQQGDIGLVREAASERA